MVVIVRKVGTAISLWNEVAKFDQNISDTTLHSNIVTYTCIRKSRNEMVLISIQFRKQVLAFDYAISFVRK